MEDRKGLAFQLEKALKECESLRAENERLKKLLGLSPDKKDSLPKPITSDPPSVHPDVMNQVRRRHTDRKGVKLNFSRMD